MGIHIHQLSHGDMRTPVVFFSVCTQLAIVAYGGPSPATASVNDTSVMENDVIAAGPSSEDAQGDDVTIEWTLMPEEYEPMDVRPGTRLTFQWNSVHNVYQLPDKESYDECEFDSAVEVLDTEESGKSLSVEDLGA